MPAARIALTIDRPSRPGQHAVGDDQVEDALAREEQAVAAVGAGFDCMTGLGQALGEIGGGRGVVLDDQDLAGQRGITFPATDWSPSPAL